MSPSRIALVFACIVACASCRGPDQPAETASALHTDSAGGLVIAPGMPYREADLAASTALVVTLPGDSTPAPVAAGPCAPEPPAETIFWVDGIREGKPLPTERRYALVSNDCGLEPRVQATVIGGAVNVFNKAGEHQLVFLRPGTSDTLQAMSFMMDGSIVASDRLTKTPGVVDVRCAAHPGEKAYIAVFDHPYFGVGASGDKVTLDALPPGDYRVMTWREGMTAPVAAPTRVGPSGQTEIILR